MLAVVVEHSASLALDPRHMPGVVLRTGMHGVDLFFVLSGFCLSYPTLSRLDAQGGAAFDTIRYAARRLVRIVPPYYIAIVLLAAVALLRGTFVSGADIFSQMMFLDRQGQSHMLNASFWTLPVEFRWYAVFPVALLVWTRSRRAFAAIAVVAVCSTATRMWSEDLLILPAFMLGIVAAQIHISGWRYDRWMLPACGFLAAAGTVATPLDWNNYAFPVWQLAAFALVVAAGSFPVLTKILSWRPLVFIGTASYSIYLVHAPAITLAHTYGVALPAAAVTGVACGIVFWACAERPFQSGETRRRWVAATELALPRWFTAIGLPRSFFAGAKAPVDVAALPVLADAPIRSGAEPVLH